MSNAYTIVVCGSVVPDPLQTLEPVAGESPSLKNEAMLPVVLDPWAAHALYEAAHLAKSCPGSKVYLVSIAPKAKLQQLMMSVAQRVPFELIAIDGSASGFTDAGLVAEQLASAIERIEGLDKERLLLFGGCASASRDAGVTMQLVGERLGIADHFMAVDEFKVQEDGTFSILERIEGGQYQRSECTGAPVVVGWATGNLPEPPNNPQLGMNNMRALMPALQRAGKADIGVGGLSYKKVELPKQQRVTRIERDLSVDQVAAEIVEWLRN